jgi:lipoprotein-anchoring transpeptidase ErfK/SrfK
MFKKLAAMAAAACVCLALHVPAHAASLVAHIDVSSQTMTVKRSGQVVHVWRVSTARSGYYTPRGTFRPQRMNRMWYSRKYDNSPMPYSVFFRGGYAIHGTGAVRQLGTPASHGCVRLHTSNAATLYSLIQQVGRRNAKIVITQ